MRIQVVAHLTHELRVGLRRNAPLLLEPRLEIAFTAAAASTVSAKLSASTVELGFSLVGLWLT